MIKITEFLISKEKLVTLVFIFIIIAGVFSLINAKKQAYGTADYGSVIITTIYPGASPKDVELKITSKIERQLKTLDGIDEFSSVSFEAFSYIYVIFEENSDYDKIKVNIQKAVDQIDDLPEESQLPVLTEIKEETRPTVEIAISGAGSYTKKRDYARLLEAQLLNQSRVASIEKIGYFDREVKIEADQQKLKDYHVSIGELMQAVRERNFRISAGDLLSEGQEKKYIILSEYSNPQELENVIIRSSISGNRVVLSDVALVKDGYKKPDRIVNYNGKEAIHLIVVKKGKADMLTTVKDIKEVYEGFIKTLPPDIQAEIVVDYSSEITDLLYLVGQNAIAGFILVLLVLFLLLHYKIAFWTAMGIPTSVFAAFILFPFFGITIDYLSLVSVIIVLGMLVDDAIIIAENIYRLREEGLSAKEAAIQGVREVMWPVVTTVLTTIIAFMPILGMSGTMGKIFRCIPIVVMVTLSVSLIEAFFILPVHMAHTKFSAGRRSFNVRMFSVLENLYEKCVYYFLRKKAITVIAFVAVLLGSFAIAATMKFVYFDSDDALSGYVKFECPKGYSLNRTAEEAKKIEEILLDFPAEEISGFVTIIGQDKSRGMSFGEGAVNKSFVGNIAIHFADDRILARSASEIMNDLRDRLKEVTGFTSIESDIYFQAPPVGRPVTVTFVSNNDKLRNSFKERLIEFLKASEGIINIEDNQDEGKRQIIIQFDYDLLARNGISPADVASTIRSAFAGTVVSSVDWEGDEVDFRVLLNEKSRSSVETLTSLTVQDVASLTIQNRYGNLLPIGQFVKLEESDDILKINHENGDRSVTVYADIDSANFPDITAVNINSMIEKEFQPLVDRDPEIQMIFGGEEKEIEEAVMNFLIAALLVIIAIYFILVILFDSFIQPLLVMLAIPFSFSGVVFAFFIHGMPLSIPAVIGLLGLMGVVVNDSLVMISFLNRRVRKYGFTIETVSEAAKRRLRPIFITTVTTAAGLFPLAYGFGGKNSFASPMVLTIAWGLIFATFVTLLLLPVLYMILTRYTKESKISAVTDS